MKTNITLEKIAMVQEYQKTAAGQLALCNELINALQAHKGKLIDKRFFAKFEGEDRHEKGYIYMQGKAWEFSKDHNHRIRLQARREAEEINLMTRETSEALEKALEKSKVLTDRMERYSEQLKELANIDEEALKADLIAVFEKHGKPSIWGDVLNLYDIKYASKD